VSATELWRLLRAEAESAAAADPVFGAALSKAILDRHDLAGAVSDQIGRRLGRSAAECERFASLSDEAFQASPDLIEAASCDLQAIGIRDPVIVGVLPPLLHFKGYVALQAWRVSNWLWHREHTDLALLLQSESSNALQVSIHPSAGIGSAVFLDHATGIVIGAYVEIGDEVTILQNVTIGRQNGLAGRAPRIGRGVLVSAGATILGDISVGDFAKIGASSVVTVDVPSRCTAVGNPARLTNCDIRKESPACC
jgi:serine O-acetyltransferase